MTTPKTATVLSALIPCILNEDVNLKKVKIQFFIFFKGLTNFLTQLGIEFLGNVTQTAVNSVFVMNYFQQGLRHY